MAGVQKHGTIKVPQELQDLIATAAQRSSQGKGLPFSELEDFTLRQLSAIPSSVREIQRVFHDSEHLKNRGRDSLQKRLKELGLVT